MTIVLNSRNTIVPNAKCCSDPRALCLRCARAAGVLQEAPAPTINQDDEPPLALPSMHDIVQNAASPRLLKHLEDGSVPGETGYVTNADDDGPLQLPAVGQSGASPRLLQYFGR